jgi:hypothetical protein
MQQIQVMPQTGSKANIYGKNDENKSQIFDFHMLFILGKYLQFKNRSPGD